MLRLFSGRQGPLSLSTLALFVRAKRRVLQISTEEENVIS